MPTSIKKIIFNIFFQFGNFLWIHTQITKYSITWPKQKYEHALYEKMPKFEQDDPKELIDWCSSTLEFCL